MTKIVPQEKGPWPVVPDEPEPEETEEAEEAETDDIDLMRIDWKKWIALVSLAFFAISCEQVPQPPTIPTPPPSPPPMEPEPEPEPVRGVPFSWDNTRGILVFPGTQASETEIRTLDARLRGLKWPTPTYHVCAEVDAWEHTQWADGPRYDSEENLENLQRFLRVTAELGSQVLLDVVCTIRDNGTSFEDIREWTRIVGGIARDFDHVAIHVANEHWHPASSLRDENKVIELYRVLRVSGFDGLISTDDNFNPGHIRYNPALRARMDWPDAHPWRNPDPTRRDIEEMVEKNGGFLVISEPTAYSSWREGGCCTSDKQQIVRYMNRCESTRGCVWGFHSTDGLSWPRLVPHFEWIPG